jgi:hypothetical protein
MELQKKKEMKNVFVIMILIIIIQFVIPTLGSRAVKFTLLYCLLCLNFTPQFVY